MTKGFQYTMRWVERFLYFWVRSRLVTKDTRENLALKPSNRVCYVFRYRSLIDLLVTIHHCRKEGLPIPLRPAKFFAETNDATFLFLGRRRLFQVDHKKNKALPVPLIQMVKKAELQSSFEIQFVPVSVFWGRNPKKGEKSILKALFFDDELAGRLQRFFIMLAQGRHVFLNFGKPVLLSRMVGENLGAEQTSKKLRRIFRVHFRRQRNTFIGPGLYDRVHVINSLVASPRVQEVIQDESRRQRRPVAKIEVKAKKYLAEISSDVSPAIVNMLDRALSWFWRKIYDGVRVEGIHELRETAQDHELVLVPCHRSHIDYLLVGWVLYRNGFVVPHFAAGINLNFWPIGSILRKGGAFFLRRSFRGDRLYSVAFTEYFQYLLNKGFSVTFFPEGGRSRTGRLLRPKTGMLSMVAESYLRNPSKEILLVPVHIAYDKVIENKSYLKELRGAKKAPESFKQFLQIRNALRSRFGQVYVKFGQPFQLRSVIDELHPGALEDGAQPLTTKPPWLSEVVRTIATRIMEEINRTAFLTPTSLVATILLATPQRAISREDLRDAIHTLISLTENGPFRDGINIPVREVESILVEVIEELEVVKLFENPGGDVVYVDEESGMLLNYYRSNTLHIFALHSLLASFFQHNDEFARDQLYRGFAAFYPFAKAELFLKWEEDEIGNLFNQIIDNLVHCGLLQINEGKNTLIRPEISSEQFAILQILGRCLGQAIERYAISMALLVQFSSGGLVSREDFEKQCELMSRRIALLNGRNEPDAAHSSGLFRNFCEVLLDLGYLSREIGGGFRVRQGIEELADISMGLLSRDARESIHRTIKRFLDGP